MKSIIKAFFKFIIFICILILIFCILGFIYNNYFNFDLSKEVETFVSDITFSSEERKVQDDLQGIIQNIENIKYETPIDNNDISKTSNYFYNQLNDDEKIIYKAFYNNKENMKKGNYQINFDNTFSRTLSEIDGNTQLGEKFQTAIDAYVSDNPDVFYIDFSKLFLNVETTTRGFKTIYKVFINSGDKSNYYIDGINSYEEVQNMINQVAVIRNYFIDNKNENIYDNIKLVHNYLVETIDYDESLQESNIYNIYGALINKKCVCEGYAKAFKYILDGIDIPCIVVTGDASNSDNNTEKHAWNYVEINDNWYAIDCTWDDPIIIGPSIFNYSYKYKYFLKGQTEFNVNHKPIGIFSDNGKEFQYPQLCVDNY